MKIDTEFINNTTNIVVVPEVKMVWGSETVGRVPLQLRSLERRIVPLELGHIFAPYSKVSYKFHNGVLKPKCTERKGWAKIDPLRHAKNVVLFENNTNKTCHFHQLAGVAGETGENRVSIPPWLKLRAIMYQKDKFLNCKKVIISIRTEKGAATTVRNTIETSHNDYIYK